MNGPDENPPPPQEHLTMERSKEMLRMQASFTLVVVAFGIYQLHTRHVWFAGFLLFGAASQALSLFALWQQHRRVKQGAVIYLKPAPATQTQMPFAVSFFVIGILTLLVSVTGLGSFYLCQTVFKVLDVRIIFGLVNFFLWLMVGFIWYRFLTAKVQTPVLENVSQPQEGVWPPPPQVTRPETNSKN